MSDYSVRDWVYGSTLHDIIERIEADESIVGLARAFVETLGEGEFAGFTGYSGPAARALRAALSPVADTQQEQPHDN